MARCQRQHERLQSLFIQFRNLLIQRFANLDFFRDVHTEKEHGDDMLAPAVPFFAVGQVQPASAIPFFVIPTETR